MKIWPKQFHTKQCSAISSPFTSVLFATFLAFSTGGKFLRPSQTPGGDIFVLFFFSSKTFWHLRLVLTVREPSAWYKSVATTLLPLVRQIDRYPIPMCLGDFIIMCICVFCLCFTCSWSPDGAACYASCVLFSTRAATRSSSWEFSSGDLCFLSPCLLFVKTFDCLFVCMAPLSSFMSI